MADGMQGRIKARNKRRGRPKLDGPSPIDVHVGARVRVRRTPASQAAVVRFEFGKRARQRRWRPLTTPIRRCGRCRGP